MNRREFISNTSKSAFLMSSLSSYSFINSNKSFEKLVILHTNDTHSHIDPFSTGKYKGMGGVLARQAIINKIRNEEKNVLLVDAGDIFQGTPYFNLFKGEIEIKAMNMLGYDASTIGNHDFDEGVENLSNQLKKATFQFVVSNYDVSNTPLNNNIKEYQIIQKGNLKIGIVAAGIELEGLVPNDNFLETKYNDPIKKINKITSHLRNNENCDIIIALSHLGYSYKNNKISDIILAQNTEDVDVIIGGHTHTFLNYPIVKNNINNQSVIINQVGFGGIHLGRLDIYIDKNLKKIKKSSFEVVNIVK